MLRHLAIACAVGLWAAPAIANVQLQPPTLSARPQRCTPRELAECGSTMPGRAVQTSLKCDSCTVDVPAEIVAPSLGDTPRPVRMKRGPDCEPRSNSPNDACAVLPPLDSLPRP